MNQLKKLLVGVDLSEGDWQVSDEVSDVTQSVINQGVEIACAADAELHLRAVIELDPKTQWLLEHYGGGTASVLDRANDAISRLVARAKSRGANATGDVALGKAWVELSRMAHEQSFDGVMVGSKRKSMLPGWLVGSTGRSLLRSCKVPVWIHKATTKAPLDQVLVATDFSEVASRALEIGAAIAVAEKAHLHVLHVAKLPSDSLMQWGNIESDKLDTAREHLLSDAREALAEQLKAIDRSKMTQPPKSHLLTGDPAEVIADQVRQHDIDLLVMGTQTHQSEAWHMMGSTAERLLSTLDCSLIAVKPADFVSQIK